MDICLYHFGLNYCSMSFITWMERLHLDEHLSIPYVTWMKMLHYGWIICWYHWSHGWKHLDWNTIHHMDENVALGFELLFIIWMKMLHLDIHVSNIIHHTTVSLRWTFCFHHSSQGWKCCIRMNFCLLSFIIWMEVLHLDDHLLRSFIQMDENVALRWTLV
jgi:hypothetical protein